MSGWVVDLARRSFLTCGNADMLVAALTVLLKIALHAFGFLCGVLISCVFPGII
jgi:hypothetical protein